MPKNTFQDIVKKSKRPVGVKSEFLPKTMSDEMKIAKKKTEEVSRIFKKQNYPAFTLSSRDNNSRRFAIWTLATLSVIFLIFALSSLFSGATVTITPKSESFSLNDTDFKAELDNPDAELSYQTMALNDVETKTISSSKSETVDKKASGRVIIYNNYNKEPQQLVINTRLEDPSSKIFRIDNAVTVPGITVQNGANVPGSVEVGIHADKTGEEYNVGLTDFTIPGFKGGPRYEKFYARSKTPIGGAIKGVVFVVPQEEAEKVRSELISILKDKLIMKATAELPKDFILFKNAVFFEVTNNDSTFESKTSDVLISVEGKLLSLILDEKKLTDKIAQLAIKDFDLKQPAYIPNLSNLNFALKTDSASLSTAKEINFSVSGEGSIIWPIDEKKLASNLAGKGKSALKDVLADYPNIARAEATVSPFWKSKFPKDVGDIKIINTLTLK